MSPCKKICKLNDTKEYCIGCYRTKKEIGEWTKLSFKQKTIIMSECEKREKTLTNR